MAKHTIWTYYYNPWQMGGSLHRIIRSRMKALGPFDLGKGYSGYLFAAPNGKTFVAESETGAIVGETIDEVKKDIAEGDEKIMKEQVEVARHKLRTMEVSDLNPKSFWKLMRCQK